MNEQFGWKLPAVVLGGLALLGILLWQSIRFWMAYSRSGGSSNLIVAVVCTLLIVVWLAVAVKMTM
jgi:hypothetical protein